MYLLMKMSIHLLGLSELASQIQGDVSFVQFIFADNEWP